MQTRNEEKDGGEFCVHIIVACSLLGFVIGGARDRRRPRDEPLCLPKRETASSHQQGTANLESFFIEQQPRRCGNELARDLLLAN
jgi:hypothetical protein